MYYMLSLLGEASKAIALRIVLLTLFPVDYIYTTWPRMEIIHEIKYILMKYDFCI